MTTSRLLCQLFCQASRPPSSNQNKQHHQNKNVTFTMFMISDCRQNTLWIVSTSRLPSNQNKQFDQNQNVYDATSFVKYHRHHHQLKIHYEQNHQNQNQNVNDVNVHIAVPNIAWVSFDLQEHKIHNNVALVVEHSKW